MAGHLHAFSKETLSQTAQKKSIPFPAHFSAILIDYLSIRNQETRNKNSRYLQIIKILRDPFIR